MATTSRDFEASYLSGALKDMFALEPGRTAAALELPREVDRGSLCRALKRYAADRGAPKQVFAALESLAHPESRAVVTGQQVGLLLGPSYTLSKAVTAIKVARQLSTEAKPVAPIFWLATQDHDVAEIDHAYVLDLKETLHKVELPLPEGMPAGHIDLDPTWPDALVAELARLDFKTPHVREVEELLRAAAAGARSYADWFGSLLYAVLGREGLILIDPLDAEIAPLFRPVIEAELSQPLASSSAIGKAADALVEMGLEPQLGRAADASNVFIEEAGQRRLLRVTSDGFSSGHCSYSERDLETVLKEQPSRLTPAAGLRPISQDAVLPTAVTVVGPGELAYFSQLRGVYDLHGIPMPLIWPRMRATVIEPPVRRIMAKYELSLSDLQSDREGRKKQTLLELHGYARAFEHSFEALARLCEELESSVRHIDPTLERSIERGQAHIEKTFELWRDKSAKALANRDATVVKQFERLERQLYPLGRPQERVLSPFSFFLKFGVREVVEAFMALPPQGERVVEF